jgi:ATP-binding cassette subfamily C protein
VVTPTIATGPNGYRWANLISLALRHRRELILAHMIAVCAALLSVPIPLLMPLLVDEVLLDQPGNLIATINGLFPPDWHGPVLYILAILATAMTLRFSTVMLDVWQLRQFTRIAKDVTFRIRKDLLTRLQHVSMSEYEVLGSGTVASHLVTDMDSLDHFFGTSISRFLVAILSIIGTAMILLWIHWPLALFILCVNPFVIYLTTILGRKVKHLKKRQNKAYEIFQQALTETLDAIQQIRAANREQHYLHQVVDRARDIRNQSTSFAWKSDAASRLSFMLFMFGVDLFRATSMLLVVFSDLSIGEMLAVFAYLWFMMGPVQEILGIQYAYHSARAALTRINSLLQLGEEPRYPHNQNPFVHNPTTSIRLDNISFAYGNGTPVLHDVSLSIQAGEKIALVGASGGGKTTLIQVILGLYQPLSGEIYFNDVPMTEIGTDVIRDNVASVLQHPALFNDNVRMNLTLGRDIDDSALWDSLEIAQLDHVVRQLPEGLDTLLGRNGLRLSGGERQRLATARMVLSEPKVVILDEATSALDTATELKLHRALKDFLVGRTTIIIAHRLSAVKQADRALVFDDGHIIEQGHHADLLASDGLYARLYGPQQH